MPCKANFVKGCMNLVSYCYFIASRPRQTTVLPCGRNHSKVTSSRNGRQNKEKVS